MCSVPSCAKVSTVQSVVSMARSSADSADSASARPATVARCGVGGDDARGEMSPSSCCGRREAVQRPGVGGTRSARRDLPGHAAADRLVHQLAERLPGGIEDLERLVDVIGQQEAGDRD